MIGVTVRKVGLEKVVANIEKRKRRAVGVFASRDFAEYCGSRGHQDIAQHFKDESGENGRWPELAASTIKRRKSSSPLMLQVKGMLRGSIKWRKKTSKQLLFLSRDKRSATHNYGRPPVGGFRARIPKREFMWFASGFLKKAADSFAKYVNQGRV